MTTTGAVWSHSLSWSLTSLQCVSVSLLIFTYVADKAPDFPVVPVLFRPSSYLPFYLSISFIISSIPPSSPCSCFLLFIFSFTFHLSLTHLPVFLSSSPAPCSSLHPGISSLFTPLLHPCCLFSSDHPPVSSFILYLFLHLLELPNPSLGHSLLLSVHLSGEGVIHVNVTKYQRRGGRIRRRGEDTLIPANITLRQDDQHRGLGRTHTHVVNEFMCVCVVCGFCVFCNASLYFSRFAVHEKIMKWLFT